MHVFNHYISGRQLRISFQLIDGIGRSTHHIFHVNAINARNAFFIRDNVLYQWKDLVPTYEERITRIDGIYMKNVVCTSADAIYELKGDAKLPARNIVIEDVHVNEVRDFVKKIDNTENVTERNVTYSFSECGSILHISSSCRASSLSWRSHWISVNTQRRNKLRFNHPIQDQLKRVRNYFWALSLRIAKRTLITVSARKAAIRMKKKGINSGCVPNMNATSINRMN